MRAKIEYTSLGEGKANFTNSSIGHVRDLESIKQQHQAAAACETCEGMSDTTKLALGLVASAGVGLLAGLLLAPQKGMDTRRKLADTASKFGSQVSRGFNTTKMKAGDWTRTSAASRDAVKEEESKMRG